MLAFDQLAGIRTVSAGFTHRQWLANGLKIAALQQRVVGRAVLGEQVLLMAEANKQPIQIQHNQFRDA